MNRLMLGATLGAMVGAFAPLGAVAQTTPTLAPISISDDLDADGVKLRGDGSIDDDQTGEDDSGDDHVRGRDREREDRDDDHHGSDHERGRDRDRDIERGGNRGHG